MKLRESGPVLLAMLFLVLTGPVAAWFILGWLGKPESWRGDAVELLNNIPSLQALESTTREMRETVGEIHKTTDKLGDSLKTLSERVATIEGERETIKLIQQLKAATSQCMQAAKQTKEVAKDLPAIVEKAATQPAAPVPVKHAFWKFWRWGE